MGECAETYYEGLNVRDALVWAAMAPYVRFAPSVAQKRTDCFRRIPLKNSLLDC